MNLPYDIYFNNFSGRYKIETPNLNRNAQSGYGVFTVILILLVTALILLELGTDFLEKMGGKIMQWNNYSRPMTGTTWDYQSQSAAAMQQISEVVSLQNEVRRELQTKEDFAKLPEQLAGGKVIRVSREKFLDLYAQLPKIYAQKLGSPVKLMQFSVLNDWNRTFFAGYEGRVDIFFLNNQNYVLEKVTLNSGFFDELERWGQVIEGNLEDIPDFAGRIYTAEEFVNALAAMDEDPDDFIGGIEILKSGQTLMKVGISRRWQGGTVEMGFQFADNHIELYPAPDDFAFQILDKLAEKLEGSDIEKEEIY